MFQLHRLLISLSIALIIIRIFVAVKKPNTLQNRKKIITAIFAYNQANLLTEEKSVTVDDVEPFISTLLRWWDWGDKRIVSPDVYKRIEPYFGKDPIQSKPPDEEPPN